MAFDGIVTKVVAGELNNLTGGRIDKILQPNKNTIYIGFYLNGKNYLLNLSIDSQNYGIYLTTHPKENPKNAFNFCMLLRKHLLNLRIKNIITSDLERVVTIEFEGFDDVDDIISKKLIIELMGKHGNIILLDDYNIILDSLRHIYIDDINFRNIVPQTKYVYPSTDKFNFLDVLTYDEFKNILFSAANMIKNNIENNMINSEKIDYSSLISNTFNGISKSFIEQIISNFNIDNTAINNKPDNILQLIYNKLTDIIELTNTSTDKLIFKKFNLQTSKTKLDFCLDICENTSEISDLNTLHLNYFLDDFYFNKITNLEFQNKKEQILKHISNITKKYTKRLLNINQKLEETNNMDIYKVYGQLITSNLYQIPNTNVSSIVLQNYYDNNSPITIPLDKKYVPSINAKRYFKKYTKLKNTVDIVSVQKIDTIHELNYLESINYELSIAKNILELNEIFDEISQSELFSSLFKKQNISNKNKVTKNTKNSSKNSTKNINKKNTNNNLNIKNNSSFNPIKYIINDNYTLLVGRNNKENEYLSLKFAKKTDLWFHTKDIHGSHCILKSNDNTTHLPTKEILEKCAVICAKHSKAKDSSNVLVDYCEVKYVKKPNGLRLGMVIYTNNKTLTVDPN